MAISTAPAAWHYILGAVDQSAWRTVGGSATPAARKARLAAGRGAERTTKRLPSCSISVSVSESRSAMICRQEPARPSAAMRSSQRLLQHQREEAAEHVTADGLVELVEDRSGGEQVLGGTEGLLHCPQLLVAEHGLEWVELGVGAQHKDAVELLVLLDLVGVDREVRVADRFEIAAKADVADQCLVALGELALQRGHDRGAVASVLFRLLMVATDDVAPTRK